MGAPSRPEIAMKFVALALLAVAALASAQTDDVPKDRCGVVVASNEDARLEIFVRGHDNQIYHKYQLNDKEWSNWASLGGVYIRGGPSVIKAADVRLVLFVRSTDRAIYYKAQTSANSATWTSWQSLGGRFASSPAAILSAEGFLHVFAVGQDRTLLHKFQFDNVTSAQPDWSPWQSLGGSMTSLPSAVIDSEGLLHVFARGPDRALWHKGQVAEQEPRSVTWSDWTCLGGIFSSGPSVSLSSDGTVELFGRGLDKAIWHKAQKVTTNGTLTYDVWSLLGGSTKSF